MASTFEGRTPPLNLAESEPGAGARVDFSLWLNAGAPATEVARRAGTAWR